MMMAEEIIESITKDQKSTTPISFWSKLCFRAETNTKQAKVSSPILQKQGCVTSWLYKRNPPSWRALYPIKKSDSII